jgi:hypothetical protein
MKPFFLVLARDEEYVLEKIEEMKALDVPFIVVCGSRLNHSNVVYRDPKGKYDAINFGSRFIPENVDVVALNDVDTKIENLDAALRSINTSEVALVFARVNVKEGPQTLFYSLLDRIRRSVLITASGELMLIKRNVLSQVIPIQPCKAEDSYVLFKVLELKKKAIFCMECYVETRRTETPEKEEAYKRRTVAGIYQALGYTKPPYIIRLFYTVLPFASPLLLILGKRGYFWTKGILLGLTDYLRGDKTGFWRPTYAK